jgi:hypothetical protein
MDDQLPRPGRRSQATPGSTDVPPPVLRLHHSDDLVEAIPYLMGFQPRDSVVLVGIEGGPGQLADAGGRVRITVRMDIADLTVPPHVPTSGAGDGARRASCDASASVGGGVDLDGGAAADSGAALDGVSGDPVAEVEDGARRAAVAIRRSGANAVVGVVFVDSEPAVALADEAADRAGRACRQASLELGDLVVVAAPGLRIRPGQDAPVDAERGTSRVAAEATYAGLVALDDRHDLVELLAPQPAVHRERLRADLAAEQKLVSAIDADGHRRRRSAIRALFAATRSLALVDDQHLVRFGAALSTTEVRDACWLAVEAGRMDGEDLWRELSRHLPAPYDAAPLFLFGWQRWRSGDGVLAGIAARRALDSDAGYTAAGLLQLAVTDGLDPFRTPRLRKGA